MDHSIFKERSHQFNSGVGKCSCGQTFKYTSKKDMKMKIHLKVSSVSFLLKGFNKIRKPKKAMTLRDHLNNETEIMRKVHE